MSIAINDCTPLMNKFEEMNFTVYSPLNLAKGRSPLAAPFFAVIAVCWKSLDSVLGDLSFSKGADKREGEDSGIGHKIIRRFSISKKRGDLIYYQIYIPKQGNLYREGKGKN